MKSRIIFESCIFGGQLKCITVRAYKYKVVIQDKNSKKNKIKLSKDDWNNLISSIRKGEVNKI